MPQDAGKTKDKEPGQGEPKRLSTIAWCSSALVHGTGAGMRLAQRPDHHFVQDLRGRATLITGVVAIFSRKDAAAAAPGLDGSGLGMKGLVWSARLALGVRGIGDTIRISLTRGGRGFGARKCTRACELLQAWGCDRLRRACGLARAAARHHQHDISGIGGKRFRGTSADMMPVWKDASL